ncbi:uncharacterized protein LOC111377567 [Olea europaea var. sylvestris]|uniref:uncharacterized protein LOC111377567 n=1 Tax=Olea europaea var. sylvestris TaxID=158386 RepID=UPI000C1D5460|nr:uncharacterized protein LOC111377567 [Olea europaea var. sylvestris]
MYHVQRNRARETKSGKRVKRCLWDPYGTEPTVSKMQFRFDILSLDDLLCFSLKYVLYTLGYLCIYREKGCLKKESIQFLILMYSLSILHLADNMATVAAAANFHTFLAILLLLIPIAAEGIIFPPFIDNICGEVQCGKGTCEANQSYPFNFRCNCENGWKRTRLDDEQNLEYLPCIIPDCSLNYSCMPAAPPLPPVPYNISFFDRNFLT